MDKVKCDSISEYESVTGKLRDLGCNFKAKKEQSKTSWHYVIEIIKEDKEKCLIGNAYNKLIG